ncbi:MAG: hypothetical protein EBU07_20215, partial [Betaproteobacteria bacterium]|nr:hypothetical protein [Betaproteobacteria bacterium]
MTFSAPLVDLYLPIDAKSSALACTSSASRPSGVAPLTRPLSSTTYAIHRSACSGWQTSQWPPSTLLPSLGAARSAPRLAARLPSIAPSSSNCSPVVLTGVRDSSAARRSRSGSRERPRMPAACSGAMLPAACCLPSSRPNALALARPAAADCSALVAPRLAVLARLRVAAAFAARRAAAAARKDRSGLRGIGPRVLAWLAQQEDLVTAFKEGKDVYKIMASAIYNKSLEDITKEERFVGKTTILGAGYGMGGSRFQAQLRNFKVQ